MNGTVLSGVITALREPRNGPYLNFSWSIILTPSTTFTAAPSWNNRPSYAI